MTTAGIIPPDPEPALQHWLEDLQANDRAKGTLTTSAMRQMIDVLVRDAAGRGLVPASTSAHTLRHTFARNYLAHYPGDVVGLASLLGHTSLDTTRIYCQPTVEQLSLRVEQLSHNAYGE
jgi:site-specific recombinase XerD